VPALRAIVFYEKPLVKFEWLLETYLAFAPQLCRAPRIPSRFRVLPLLQRARGAHCRLSQGAMSRQINSGWTLHPHWVRTALSFWPRAPAAAAARLRFKPPHRAHMTRQF